MFDTKTRKDLKVKNDCLKQATMTHKYHSTPGYQENVENDNLPSFLV